MKLNPVPTIDWDRVLFLLYQLFQAKFNRILCRMYKCVDR